MKFGQGSPLPEKEYLLPTYLDEDLLWLKELTKNSISPGTKFYLGSTSWNNPEWKGSIYPAQIKLSDMTKAYGRSFNTIELNTTHYRIPDPTIIRKWSDAMPDDFKFCPKFPQLISHRKDLGIPNGALVQFLEAIQYFGDKLGPSFYQCPTYYTSKHFDSIQRIHQRIAQKIPWALELRDASFFSKELISWLIPMLREYHICWVHTDTPQMRSIVHAHLTAPFLMVRFVACGDRALDEFRLQQWIIQMRQLSEYGLQEIYFFLHESETYKEGELNIYLWNEIQKQTHFKGRGPTPAVKPIQTKLF